MDFVGLQYRGLDNAGDYIQSIATERLMPPVIERHDRDMLKIASPESLSCVIMNGWFSHDPGNCLPISPNIIPVFWGFHITDWNNGWEYFLKDETLSYLKKHEPIGCRDPFTAYKLKENGIETFVSRCLSLTLPLRKEQAAKKYIFIVDGEQLKIPEHIKKEAISFTHHISAHHSEQTRWLFSKHLLYQYAANAKLVITSRLHCALPCIAMGIPVVFFGNKDDYRVSWISELGIPINAVGEKNIDWNPEPVLFEDKKNSMINDFKSFLSQKLNITAYE